jgi:hypothetical protein
MEWHDGSGGEFLISSKFPVSIRAFWSPWVPSSAL